MNISEDIIPEDEPCEACGYVTKDNGFAASDVGHENLCCGQSGFSKDEDCGDRDCVTHAEDIHYPVGPLSYLAGDVDVR